MNNVDKVKFRKRTKYLPRIREILRLSFRSDYLGQLRQQSVKLLKVGEIVLREDSKKKSGLIGTLLVF